VYFCALEPLDLGELLTAVLHQDVELLGGELGVVLDLLHLLLHLPLGFLAVAQSILQPVDGLVE